MQDEDAGAECRRLLEAFGYQWNGKRRKWERADAGGGTISQRTVAAWTVDQARIFLTREAARAKR